MYSLEDITLVLNLATRACSGTVVYPEGFLGKFEGGFAFYPLSLMFIGKKIYN